MPIYEYWCSSCHRAISSYRQITCAKPPPCPYCGNKDLERVFSTFSIARTQASVYEGILSDRELTQGMLRDDPRALAEWSKRMSGGEQPSPEYEEITERMEKGEWPNAEIDRKKRDLWSEGERA